MSLMQPSTLQGYVVEHVPQEILVFPDVDYIPAVKQVLYDSAFAQDDNAISKIIEAQIDYGNPIDPYIHTHTTMKNEFYREFYDALLSEYTLLTNSLNGLKTLYDLNYYDGDQSSFLEKVTNLSSLLGFNLPMDFLPYTNIESGYNNIQLTSSVTIAGYSYPQSLYVVQDTSRLVTYPINLNWNTNQWVNYSVTITGTRVGYPTTTQTSLITANDTYSLSLSTPWSYALNYLYTYTIFGSLDNINNQNNFLRGVLGNVWLMRRWVGSLNGYKLPVRLIHRTGSVQIGSTIPTLSLNPLTGKVFKFLNTGNLVNILPNLVGSIFPNVGNVEGYTNISQVPPIYQYWDIGITYDQNDPNQSGATQYTWAVSNPTNITPPLPQPIGTPPAFPYAYTWDRVSYPSVILSAILIELSLDRILTYPNSIASSPSVCLLENVFMDTVAQLATTVSKASDKVMVGSQLTLMTTKDGYFNSMVNVSGTCALSSNTQTLTDSSTPIKSWATNAWVGATVVITSGVNIGATNTVVSNTGTVLTLTNYWTVATGSDYSIRLGGFSYTHPNIQAKFQFFIGTTTGTVTLAGSLVNTVTVGTASWTTNQWVGATFLITGGTSSGATGTVISNTPTVLTLQSTLTTGTDSTFLLKRTPDGVVPYLSHIKVGSGGFIKDGISGISPLSDMDRAVTSFTDSSHIVVSGSSWVDHYWKNSSVVIFDGTGQGSSSLITDNTPTTLTLATPIITDTTSQVTVKKTVDGNVFVDSSLLGPSPTALQTPVDLDKVQLTDLQNPIITSYLSTANEIIQANGFYNIHTILHEKDIKYNDNLSSITLNNTTTSTQTTTINCVPSLTPGTLKVNINIDVSILQPIVTTNLVSSGGVSIPINSSIPSDNTFVFIFGTATPTNLGAGNITIVVSRFSQTVSYSYPTSGYSDIAHVLIDIASRVLVPNISPTSTPSLPNSYINPPAMADWAIIPSGNSITLISKIPEIHQQINITDYFDQFLNTYNSTAIFKYLNGILPGVNSPIPLTPTGIPIISDFTSIATASGTTTFIDSGATWTTNEWSGTTLIITSGMGKGKFSLILGNTSTVLTLETAIATDTTSVYYISSSTNVMLSPFTKSLTSSYVYSCVVESLEGIKDGNMMVNGIVVPVYSTDLFENIAVRVSNTPMTNWIVSWELVGVTYTIYLTMKDPYVTVQQLAEFGGYTRDTSYEHLSSNPAFSYLSTIQPNAFNLVPFSGQYDSKNNPLYIQTNYSTGTILLNIQYNPLGPLGTSYGATATSPHPYTIENMMVDDSFLASSYPTNIAISEVGLFDTYNNMVAYGTFPSIIYNPRKYHLDVNLLLSQ